MEPASTNALFEEFSLGKLTLASRIVMAPMTRNFSPAGVPGADVADYYRRRAEAGVGLIMTEGTYIDHPSAGRALPTWCMPPGRASFRSFGMWVCAGGPWGPTSIVR
jgi:2,4-dienoyl-CoA reductase-like NADH-dependent reductase (Old Yellow Enzyme family)